MNQSASRQVLGGEDPKDFFLHRMPREPAARGEDPKDFFRRMSRQQQHAAAAPPQAPAPPPEGLTEERPEQVAEYCQRVHQAGPEGARHMLNPLIRLDYARLDPELAETVEDALYFGMLGVERPAHRQPENAPANAR